jgi:hypothetical protein
VADYSRQITKSQRKIAEKGMVMSYITIAKGAYDPVSDGYAHTETRTVVNGVKTSPTKEEVSAGLFEAGSMVILLVAGDVSQTPTIADRLEFSGRRWAIERIRSVEPAEEAILYKLQVNDEGIAP